MDPTQSPNNRGSDQEGDSTLRGDPVTVTRATQTPDDSGFLDNAASGGANTVTRNHFRHIPSIDPPPYPGTTNNPGASGNQFYNSQRQDRIFRRLSNLERDNRDFRTRVNSLNRRLRTLERRRDDGRTVSPAHPVYYSNSRYFTGTVHTRRTASTPSVQRHRGSDSSVRRSEANRRRSPAADRRRDSSIEWRRRPRGSSNSETTDSDVHRRRLRRMLHESPRRSVSPVARRIPGREYPPSRSVSPVARRRQYPDDIWNTIEVLSPIRGNQSNRNVRDDREAINRLGYRMSVLPMGTQTSSRNFLQRRNNIDSQANTDSDSQPPSLESIASRVPSTYGANGAPTPLSVSQTWLRQNLGNTLYELRVFFLRTVIHILTNGVNPARHERWDSVIASITGAGIFESEESFVSAWRFAFERHAFMHIFELVDLPVVVVQEMLDAVRRQADQ